MVPHNISFLFPAHLSQFKPRSSFGFHPVLKNPNFLLLGSSIPASRSLISLDSTRCFCSPAYGFQMTMSKSKSSGESHAIVGSMFVGKTTTLLRQIQSQVNNGSFQAQYPESSSLLDRILNEFCHSGRLREAIELLVSSGLAVEWQTCSLILQECINRKEYELGRRIHAKMVVVGFVTHEYLKTKLLILYAKAGHLETASALFDNLSSKSLIAWNAMIAGYVQNGLEEEGLSLFYQMRGSGLIPDQFTFASVFRACGASALLEQGRQAHGIMIKCHIGSNVVVNGALIDFYFKCSCPLDGHRVFNSSSEKSVITWSALISGYGNNGMVREVLELFDAMVSKGFKPNYVTLLAVLSACSHGGLVSEGWKYFSSMESVYGIRPKPMHYAAMVDLLGRAGRLKEAYEFVSTSPYKEHPAVWGALLGACRIHGNVDLVHHSANKFFDFEAHDAGKYVVLSNCYATHGLWENVAEIWGLMKDSKMRKDPGHSRIEIQNDIHFFFTRDNTHKQAEKTCEVLMELTCCLRDADYDPNTSIK